MQKCLRAYNNSIHSSTGIKPNAFNIINEIDYIGKMDTFNDKNTDELEPNTHVRVINDKVVMGKKRSNLSANAYLIDSKVKNKYIIKAKDNTASEYPRYRLVRDNKAKLAKTFNTERSGTKRSIIDKIKSYDAKKHKYNTKFIDGTTSNLTIHQIREGRPTKLSPEELRYWSKNKSFMPKDIAAYIL